jgi:hypothetical protein
MGQRLVVHAEAGTGAAHTERPCSALRVVACRAVHSSASFFTCMVVHQQTPPSHNEHKNQWITLMVP